MSSNSSEKPILERKLRRLLRKYSEVQIKETLHYCLTTPDPRKSHKTSSSNKSSSSSGSIQRVDSEDSQPVIGAPVQNADVKLEEVDIKKIDDDMKARAMQLFSLADKDGNGLIDEYELHNLLTNVLGHITLPESNRLYHEMDTNHSGYITFDELLAGLIKYKDTWMKTPITPRIPSVFDWEIPYNELEFVSKLGGGAYGDVYLAKWRGLNVAVKKLKKKVKKQEMLEDFRNEVSILAKLRHPNCVLFMGACTGEENLVMVTEFIEGGNLFELVHKQKVKYDMPTLLWLAKQMAFGLNYLHLSGIIHRDLKLANLLVDKHNNLKLCDFGLSTVKPKENALREKIGSPVWRSPEMLMGEGYDESTDVYAFAINLWEMLSNTEFLNDPNFQHVEDLDSLCNAVVTQGKRPTIPTSCPPELAALIRSCWDRDPKKRPNFGQIITHLERISLSLSK